MDKKPEVISIQSNSSFNNPKHQTVPTRQTTFHHFFFVRAPQGARAYP